LCSPKDIRKNNRQKTLRKNKWVKSRELIHYLHIRILSVATWVSSPSKSSILADELSVIVLKLSGFQFLICIAPAIERENMLKTKLKTKLKTTPHFNCKLFITKTSSLDHHHTHQKVDRYDK